MDKKENNEHGKNNIDSLMPDWVPRLLNTDTKENSQNVKLRMYVQTPVKLN